MVRGGQNFPLVSSQGSVVPRRTCTTRDIVVKRRLLFQGGKEGRWGSAAAGVPPVGASPGCDGRRVEFRNIEDGGIYCGAYAATTPSLPRMGSRENWSPGHGAPAGGLK